MALRDRGYVRNACCGNHLGQWSCATTSKGRTYGSKLSDLDYQKNCLQVGAVHTWTYNKERLNMGIGGVAPSEKLKMAA